jgi:hypothetical protein
MFDDGQCMALIKPSLAAKVCRSRGDYGPEEGPGMGAVVALGMIVVVDCNVVAGSEGMVVTSVPVQAHPEGAPTTVAAGAQALMGSQIG